MAGNLQRSFAPDERMVVPSSCDRCVFISQDHNDQAIAVGATLAHEMGHNLGMDHDDSSACTCAGDSCIMAAALR